jgi:hypothetical protein
MILDDSRTMPSPWPARLLLIGLVVLLMAVTIVWLSIDRRPPDSDHANHLERALRCHRILADGAPHPLRRILEESSFYPPVVPCLAGLLYFVAPVVPLTAQAVMLAFLVVGVAAVFALGRRLDGEAAGVLAAFFFGTAPFVVYSLVNFQLDLPLAAMVAVALYVLVRADGFARPPWCVMLGFVLGLGMLTKPPFATYVLPAIVWCLWSARRQPGTRRRLAWLAVALIIGMILSIPWYGPRLLALPMQIVNRSFKQAAEAGQVEALTPAGLSFYPRVFLPQFGLLAGPLCAVSLFALLRKPRARALLWLSTLAPFVLYSLIQNKNLRYTLPILPAAALVTAMGVTMLHARWRRGVIAACLAVGALQVSMTAFGVPRPPVLALFQMPLPISFPPSPADWQEDRVLDDVAWASGGAHATVAVVPNYNFFSVSNFRYEALRRRLPFEMTRGWTGPPLGVDFVILKTGSQGPSYTVEKSERLARAFAEDPYLAEVFPVIAEYPLPDGSRGILRARRVPTVRGVDAGELARRLERAQEAALADYVRDVRGLRIALTYQPEALLRGEVARLRVEAETATVGEMKRRDRAPLTVRRARIDAERLLINPRRVLETGTIEILDAGSLRIDALLITQADVDALLGGQPAGRALAVKLGDGAATVTLKQVRASARVTLQPGEGDAPFTLRIEEARLWNARIPDLLMNWVARHFDPTARLKNLPVKVSIAPMRIRPGRIEIGSPSDPKR